MIDREQLAEALDRLDPRDREVLDYSLRRRVPDEDLSSVFGLEPPEVARMRAAAVDRVANELGVERGEDLGQVLRLLLEPATWDLLPAAPEPPAEPPPAEPPPAEAPEPAPQSESHEPVLGMLAGRADPESVGPAPRRSRRSRVLAGVAVAVAVLAPAGMVAALTNGDSDGDDPGAESSGSSGSGTRPFRAQPQALGDPFPSDPKAANRYPVAYVKRPLRLLAAPGGKLKVRIGRKTEFSSPRVLGVVKRRGPWLAVLVPELDNGDVGWVRQDKVSGLDTVSWSLHVDLSRRTLVVRRDGKRMRSVRIGVGRSDHRTPEGRYAVTDKLRVTAPGSPYGCCVLALTGHQTKLPPGWPGGDRLAIHATRDTSGLGKAVSLGCMRSHPRDARWMMKQIPLGAPVFVRA